MNLAEGEEDLVDEHEIPETDWVFFGEGHEMPPNDLNNTGPEDGEPN